MASSGGPIYTAGQVCAMLTGDDDDGDLEYIFPGSDDDFDPGDLEEEYDRVSREQARQDLDEPDSLLDLDVDLPSPSSPGQGTHLVSSTATAAGSPQDSDSASPSTITG